VPASVAPLAGAEYTGASGGRGTNAFVSRWPLELFHLRSNKAAIQLKIAGFVVK